MFFRAYRIGVMMSLLFLLASLHIRADALPEESCPFFTADVQSDGLERAPSITERGHSLLDPTVMAWSSDGMRLAIGENVPPLHSAPMDRWVSIYNFQTEKIEQRLNQPFGVFRMTWSPDGARLATVNGSVRVWEIGKVDPIFEIETGAIPVWSPDGQELGLISSNSITVVDAANAQQLRVVESPGAISDLLASWSSNELVWPVRSGDADTINYQVWGENRDTALLSFGSQYRSESGVSLSPNGTFAVAYRDNVGVELWDVETGELVQTLDEELTTIHWSADERCIAAITIDESPGNRRYIPKLWDVRTGRNLVLPEGIDTIHALSPDGTMLATTDDSGTITIWRVPQDD